MRLRSRRSRLSFARRRTMRRAPLFPLLGVGLAGTAIGRAATPVDASVVEGAKKEVMKVENKLTQTLQKGDSDTVHRICAGSGAVGQFEVSASSVRHIDWYHAFCQEADTSVQVNRYEEGPAGGEKAPIRAIQR
jgi:hypothetical protein